jgi:hypothetical protein
LIYWLKIPGISTSVAGRIAVLFALGGGVLLSTMVEKIRSEPGKNIVKYFFPIEGTLIFLGIIIFLIRKYFQDQDSIYLAKDIINVTVTLRNLVIPILLVAVSFVVIILFRKNKKFYYVLGLIIVADLFRFGWKYLPIVRPEYVFPETEITNFLKDDKEIFRVEKEYGPLLSPNTWTMYGLMSPSGYDPMALAEYTQQFNKDLNGVENKYSRYAEIERYNAKSLGDYNVKYLLTLKKNNKFIDLKEWIKVKETKEVVILKNKSYLPRAFIEGVDNKVEIVDYQANKVSINYEAISDGQLILLDTWYPGWEAIVNGKPVTIEKYKNIFRKVGVTKGVGKVEFVYKPKAFEIGAILSLLAFIVWLILIIKSIYSRSIKK